LQIDLVITELFPGGAERCFTQLALGLAARGELVRVCSLASLPAGPQRLLVNQLEEAQIEVRSCEADRARQALPAFRKLMAWMRQGEAQVCQTFLYHANVLGTAAARRTRRRIIVGGLRVAEHRRMRCRIERWATRRMDRLVCVSRAVQVFAAEHLACPPHQSVVIPNGIDVSRWESAQPIDWSQLGWPSKVDVILFVGRLHPQKGLDQLQNHLDRLVPRGSSRRLLIVGDGPQRAELDRWIDRHGQDRVQCLGWQAELAPLMRAARVLVLPSRYEGMPNVVMEAMAAARPVVCSRVEGVQELLAADLADMQTYDVDDHAQMIALVDSFCDDHRHGDQIGRENQRRVLASFTLDIMVDAYRELYQSLLADRCEGR